MFLFEGVAWQFSPGATVGFYSLKIRVGEDGCANCFGWISFPAFVLHAIVTINNTDVLANLIVKLQGS